MIAPRYTPAPWSVSPLTPLLIVADVGPDPEQPSERLVRNLALTSGTHPSLQSNRNDEAKANARLIAAAPDHALVAWAVCVGGARWAAWHKGESGLGEICINGFCHATRLDEFGVPEVTPNMRAVLVAAREGAA